MPPPKPAYDVDWIFSNNSDVHVATHRDWFTSFTPFSTKFDSGVGCFFDRDAVRVSGIGDVQLPTKTHPTRSGTVYQGYVVLRDVLYAPDALCNIIGGPCFDDYKCNMGGGFASGKLTARTNGACAGIFDRSKLYRLRLRGQTAKQTSLDLESSYVIRAHWHPDERARWESFRSGHGECSPCNDVKASTESPELTQEEKQWLKDNYRGEFHFLRAYGWSIYKEEDRDEGRRTLRALMEDSSDGASDGASETSSTNSSLRDLENGPTSHAADYHFSESELNWIKAEFGHSGHFLRCYGLKFYDDEDCREGRAIVQAMIQDDMPELID
ncbi:MAG: hypothetical protein LQ346_008145 [Caloplaca aetnensis]|nr:MAG: hypothetical protein LQ346_008145 [Caloplaca aetnensis]